MLGIKLKSCLRPKRKTFLTSSIPYIGLELTTASWVQYHEGISFQCGQVFRRDEIQHHQNAIHNHILPGLESWLYERCPMHRFGCKFIRQKFKPKNGNLRHDLSVNCWTSSQQIKRQRHTVPILTDLPNETLFHIMSNLDAHALKNIRKASKKLFYLTETFVGERGMVQPVWKKDINGKWKIAEFSWIFSNYSNLKEWTMTSEPSIGNHLRTCSFLKRDQKNYSVRPAPLPAMAQGTQVKNYKITYD